MPYEWLPSSNPQHQHLRLWPWRSLAPRGFVWFIGVTAGLITLPLLAVMATPIFWGLLPFLAGAIAVIWWALRRSWADRGIVEDLVLTRDDIRLRRTGPGKRHQEWQANPYWVEIRLYESGGPVQDYLTLRGNGREVEIGAFLGVEERRALREELIHALSSLRQPED